MTIKRSAVKLTLQRVITSYSESSKPKYGWVFRQESYTREPWESFQLPVVCGVAGVYTAYLEDAQEIEAYKQKLKDKALEEMQENIAEILEQIDSLGNVE